MADQIIITGDLVIFMPKFGEAMVAVLPGEMSGTGKSTVNGKKICLEGDEKSLEVPNCLYNTLQFTIPGMGTLKIDKLGGDQLTKTAKDTDKPMILKGGQFTAKFEVLSPALDPTVAPAPPKPDTTSAYAGEGSFMTTNINAKAE